MSAQKALLSSPTSSLHINVIDGALVIEHWGAPLTGEISALNKGATGSVSHSAFDVVPFPGVMRESSRGFLGRPALSGHRNGKSWVTKFEVTDFHHQGNSVVVTLRDLHAELEVVISYVMDSFGIVKIDGKVKNLGSEPYTLDEFIYWLPLHDGATEKLDFAGRWSNERNPQRSQIDIGLWARESREGRSGHNFTITQMALTPQSSFQNGSVWAMGLAWSGNCQNLIDKQPEGWKSMGAGEILLPGEIILAAQESYEAPSILATFSAEGLDGISAAYHQHLRARANHPKRPRPLTLNMWEAVYFDHRFERIQKIIDAAADVGVERVVLDDGWFMARRNDQQGLGDWIVDPAVWPEGLTPLADYIESKGIEFGLWFEGEMVQVDSDLYRAHPEWIFHEGDRLPMEWRHQQVLDLGHEGAYNHVLEQVSKVIGANRVKYIKWDHNRVITEASHLGRGGVKRQTEAIYKLFDELKRRHPGLEIESCASGGARIDLGMVDHADRFWTSDNNCALARQTIQRWTMQAIAPELLGTHIGPTIGHQTGRYLELSFRAATALFGHAGIEWDITEATPEQKEGLKGWASYYKKNRDFLHSAKMVRVDYPDQHAYLYGVSNKERAIYSYAQLEPCISQNPSTMTFPGLDPAARYEIKAVYPAGKPGYMAHGEPAWLGGIELSGSALGSVGVAAPLLRPANALLIEINKK